MGDWGELADGGWGRGAWGGGAGLTGSGAELQIVSADAIAENVVRLFFSEAPLFNGLRTPNDASVIARYSVTVVPGTFGLDELPTRTVAPAFVAIGAVAGAEGSVLDLTVDRPFSPFPSQYLVAVNQLVSAAAGTPLAIGHTSTKFFGVYRGRVPPLPANIVARRDIANPQTAAALLALPGVDPNTPLATYAVDASGDYAADSGTVSYKKRVFRRLTTGKGRFAHLPAYGVGVPDAVKKLGRAGFIAALAADAEAQIRQEPETLDVKVTQVATTGAPPGFVRLRIRAKTKAGDSLDGDFDFPTGG